MGQRDAWLDLKTAKKSGIISRQDRYILPTACHSEGMGAFNVMIFVSPQRLWIIGRIVTYVSPPVRPVKTSVAEIDRAIPRSDRAGREKNVNLPPYLPTVGCGAVVARKRRWDISG